jgi:hypothetical protein
MNKKRQWEALHLLLQDENRICNTVRVVKFDRSSFWSINGTELIITELKQNVLLWGFPGLPARPYESLDSSELCIETQFLPHRGQQFVFLI